MAGIYIHIPFCKQACHYCDFHFSTSLKYQDRMMQAIQKEIIFKQNELGEQEISTIYFGGGTPSLLSADLVDDIISSIRSSFPISSSSIEITFEVNPDDVSLDYLLALKQAGVNRLSIGIQSFMEEDLKFMNRAHDSLQARQCLENVAHVGFDSYSLDLIYGIHTLSDENWQKNISQALSYNPPHISAYCLTIEERTVFGHKLKNGALRPIDEDKANRQLDVLIKELSANGYDHYEISNFAKPNHYSQHNSNYWNDQHYVGIGPSAHSYDGSNRAWNIANNAKYMESLERNIIPSTLEKLSINDRYNEYIMTRIRTIWGVDPQDIKMKFGEQVYHHFSKEIINEKLNKWIIKHDNSYILNKEGIKFADAVALSLFR